MVKSRPANRLQKSFEDQIIDFILKLQSYKTPGTRPLSVGEIYDTIRQSPTALARNKRRTLEDAIEKALAAMKEEAEIQEKEADFQKSEAAAALNNNVVAGWKTKPVALKNGKPRKNGDAEIMDGVTETEAPSAVLMSDGRPKEERPKKRRRSASPESTGIPMAVVNTVALAESVNRRKARSLTTQTVDSEVHIGGVSDILTEIETRIFPYMIKNILNLSYPGLLLCGPIGCGKATVVEYLAWKWGVPIVRPNAGTLLNADKVEKALQEVFDEVQSIGSCVVLFEELERYFDAASTDSSSLMHFQIHHFTSHLTALLRNQTPEAPVAVIATASTITKIPQRLLLAPFFMHTITMSIPSIKQREEIISAFARRHGFPLDLDLAPVARIVHGYLPVDLLALFMNAQVLARHNDREFPIFEDFIEAKEKHVPYMLQHGFNTIPSVTFDNVGGLGPVLDSLQQNIIGPLLEPETYRSLGLSRPNGVIMWGPPGCGKTLVAQAVANAAQASFILIKGPELLDKFVGESERKIRELFTRARSCAPCLLFFDEMDSLVPKRENTTTESGARVVNTFLTELDGAQGREGVFVIATTNRPDMIDSAMLRPGRLDTKLFVDIPSPEERIDILKTIVYGKRKSLIPDAEVDVIKSVALDDRCSRFSGADLTQLRKHAAQKLLVRVGRGAVLRGETTIGREDWEQALNMTKATLTEAQYKQYQKMAESMV